MSKHFVKCDDCKEWIEKKDAVFFKHSDLITVPICWDCKKKKKVKKK